jgi:hypothetical protein
MAGICKAGKEEEIYKILISKSYEKRSLRKCKHGQEDNIKRNHKEIF